MLRSSTQACSEIKLTVYFDEPFWAGVFENLDGNKLCVCKVTFGAEPTDAEVYDFVLKKYNDFRFTKQVKTFIRKTADNPKRRQREAKKQTQATGIGTKSQQILKQQYEENKLEHKQKSRDRREEEKHRQFELKQQKRKEKHKGH